MKKFFFCFVLLLLGSQMEAQMTPTEYVGTNPFFFSSFYPPFRSHEFIHDSILCRYAPASFYSVMDSLYISQSVDDGINGLLKEYAIRYHCDDTLHIIGMAAILFWSDERKRVTIMDTNFNILRELEDSVPHIPIGSYDQYPKAARLIVCNIAGSTPDRMNFYYHIFDTPISIQGDFYMSFARYDHTGKNTIFPPAYRLIENHQPPYAFPILHQALQHRDDSSWEPYGTHSASLYFPLIDPQCTIPGISTTLMDDSCLRVEWDSNNYVLTDSTEGLFPWQVRYAPVGSNNFTVVDCDTNVLTLCNLSRGVGYTFSVRSRCDRLTYPHWTDWSDAVTIGDTTSVPIVELERKIVLAPNPATGHVTLTAPTAIVSIDVYDAAGRIRTSLMPHSTTADIALDGWPRGVYSLVVVTTQGTITKRLLVEPEK